MQGAYVSIHNVLLSPPWADEGHILAFLTGQDEIEKACALLNKSVQEEQEQRSIKVCIVVGVCDQIYATVVSLMPSIYVL